MIKKNKHTVDTAITLFTQCLLYLCYFGFVIERGLLMVLVFNNKGMLEKEAMQKKTQLVFLEFSLLSKEPS